MSSRKYYFTNQSEFVRTAYKGLMRNLIVLLRDDSGFISPENMALVQADADAVYELETFLAEVRSIQIAALINRSINQLTQP